MILEHHDLPNNGEKKCCWISIDDEGFGEYKRYHYTLRGCYIIEYAND